MLNLNENIKILSLFSGIGGFELGIEQALGKKNYEVVGFSEIDKYATQIYKKHFPNHHAYGDITKISTDSLPDFEILVGGFPCQAFSVAGKRRGFADTRGTLFFEIARILRDKMPKYFLLENVKGLLSHDRGSTFSTIIETLQEIGYGVSWKVLNSKNFGVPQNRERVFIFGVRGESPREILPIREGDKNDYEEKPSSTTIDANYSKGIDNHGARTGIIQLNSPKHSNDRVYSEDGISPTLNTMQGGRRQPFIKQKPRGKNKGGLHKIAPTLSSNSWQDNNHLVTPVLTPDRLEKRQNGRRFKNPGEPSFTLTAQDRHGILKNQKIRKLTPLECERLQGFPDFFTQKGINEKGKEVEISDSQRYKCLGNAVTVSVIRAITQNII
jgi:DNA (cytosine-5)-methyltransferase 1